MGERDTECCPICVPALCDDTTEQPSTTVLTSDDCVGCVTCDGGSFYDGCNTCSCSDDGLTICTLRYCEPAAMEEPYCYNPDCDDIACAAVACEDTQIETTLAGECCSSCVERADCTQIDCRTLEDTQNFLCEENEMAVFVDGECCPLCVVGICDDNNQGPTAS